MAAFSVSDGSPSTGHLLLEAYKKFVTACDAVRSEGAFEPLLARRGWEKYEPEAGEPMGRVISYLAKERWRFEKDGEASVNDPITFRQQIGDEQFELMVQEIQVDGGLVIGCRAWNFRPSKAPSLDELVELKAEQPNRKMSSPDLLMVEWGESENGVVLGSQIHFFPSDSPSSKAIGASGLSFKMSFVRISE
jgi:hypothetical protein